MSKEAVIVHRSRLYVPEIYTVNCLAYDAVQRKLSVGRRVADANDSSYPNVIEIWNAAEPPNLFRELTIPFRDCSLEAMVWCQKRLFCAASDGSVTEYSAHRVTPLNWTQVCSCPIWCLAKNSKETLIAVGTDTGAIYLLSVLAGESEWNVEKILTASFDFRILSLAWHPNDTILAGGSLDCIQTWDAESGRPLVRINTGRAERKKETIVWSLAITRDSVIVSGDSRGKVCFWNAKTGSLINSHELHQADVLAVALTKSAAFAAGVDPRMHTFTATQFGRKRSDSTRESAVLSSTQAALRPETDGSTTTGEWRPTAMRSTHTHDVRAIVPMGEHLVSAGTDSFLCLTPSYNFKSPNIAITPFDSTICRLANKAGRALIQYSTHLDVWVLGKTSLGTTVPLSNSVLHTAENPSKLVELRSKKGALILASAISADGQIVAFSDRLSTTVVRITEIDSAPAVHMAKTITGERLASAVSLVAASTASFVLLATDDQRLLRVDIDGLALTPVHLVESFDVLGGIRKLQLSTDDRKAAGITTSYEILIFDVLSGQLLHTVKPPRAVPVDCGFFDNDRLAVLYGAGTDFHLAEIVVSARRLSEWNVSLKDVFHYQGRRSSGNKSPRSISVADEQVIVASDDKFVVVRRQAKRDLGALVQSADGLSHVVSAEWMKQDSRGGELLLTQIDPLTYVRRLPPAMRLKRFGVN